MKKLVGVVECERLNRVMVPFFGFKAGKYEGVTKTIGQKIFQKTQNKKAECVEEFRTVPFKYLGTIKRI